MFAAAMTQSQRCRESVYCWDSVTSFPDPPHQLDLLSDTQRSIASLHVDDEDDLLVPQPAQPEPEDFSTLVEAASRMHAVTGRSLA